MVKRSSLRFVKFSHHISLRISERFSKIRNNSFISTRNDITFNCSFLNLSQGLAPDLSTRGSWEIYFLVSSFHLESLTVRRRVKMWYKLIEQFRLIGLALQPVSSWFKEISLWGEAAAVNGFWDCVTSRCGVVLESWQFAKGAYMVFKLLNLTDNMTIWSWDITCDLKRNLFIIFFFGGELEICLSFRFRYI